MKYKRDIKYVNKDFAENRQALINYAKTYFPNTFQDFNESDPGMMMMEMVAYVGDVLGYYADINLQESLMKTADERINLYNISQAHGYKAKTITPANVELEVFQLIPAIGEGVNTKPDFRYALYIEPNMTVYTDDEVQTPFYTLDAVDFRFSSSYDPTTTTVHSVTNDGSIEYYLLKKTVKAISGEIHSEEFQFGEPKPYDKIVLQNEFITEIISVTDEDNNTWYEVPYLAQDTIPISIRNTHYFDPKLSKYRSSVPYILCYKQTEYRFIKRLRKDDFTEIQFGSGLSLESDEEIVPNPMNVGLGLNYMERVVDLSIDPSNFLYTRTYGSSPNNTTLTIRYVTARGLSDNVGSNIITKINQATIVDPADSTDPLVLDTIKDSLAVNNPRPAWGGQNRKELEVVRHEAMANFAAQNRAVTKEDYILRCYTMPAKFGAVAKAYIEQDTQLGNIHGDRIPNPYSLNLYVLAYDANKNFVACNEAMLENLRAYMKQYRLLTDAVNIKTPWVINLGITVDIMTTPSANSNEVILKCLNKMIEMFKPERMGINEPIIISKIRSELDDVEGVETVADIQFENLVDMNRGYSGNVYPVENAIAGGILYPSVSPSIFEVKYPKRDIKIRVTEY